jgi:hypothetical protein
MSSSRKARKSTWFLIALTMIGIAAAARAPAGAQTAPGPLTGVAIAGDPLVGQTLTAVPTPNDAVVTQYRWRRCLTANNCKRIEPHDNDASYVVVQADVGAMLEVRAIAPSGNERSTRTAVVTDPNAPVPTPTPTPSPTPTPTPTPTPSPDPPSGPRDDPPVFEQSGKQAPPPASVVPIATLAEQPLVLMRPFPVVRVKGVLVGRGARITLLRVKAPSSATVVVRCKGPGCRVKRRLFGTSRVSVLERYLAAGVRITIRVFRPGAVGKYVRLVIRDGSAPKRRDACLVANNSRPAECPDA